ncbi:MAG: uracil phosphoribosyltransferase [Aquificae bacterium]|nr:uracil phosphoribosyltransferase [Aquificota bacterium]
MGKLAELDHPVVKHLITRLRDVRTRGYTFRKTVSQLTKFLINEAFKEEKTVLQEVETWIGKGQFPSIMEERLVFIPVLRAGLPMLDGALEVFNNAKAGFLAIKRDENTLKSKVYYEKIPDLKSSTAVILDPMVATGGSLQNAVSVVKEKNPDRIVSLNLIGVKEGLNRVMDSHPEVEIYIAQIDERLNDKGYIIPGIGDAGDRAFNT